jgi:olefin beta-lactone synthetase
VSPQSASHDIAETLRSVGLDPAWSRRVVIERETTVGVHVLDRPGTAPPSHPTVVCVHGNPTWSVLWAAVLRDLDPAYRVVAFDQVDMGWSDRVTAAGEVRRFTTRVGDLDAVLAALDIDGPVILMGHDWGGAVAAGWAVDHAERVAALVLANTGVAVPTGRQAPALIRAVARPALLDLITRRTPWFVQATPRLPGPRLDPNLRRALAAPYRSASRRGGIAGFVADIPFDDRHPSASALDHVARSLANLTVPTLLVWGARDPVFDDTFADDLRTRLPHAELQRFPQAGHLSPLEVDLAGVVSRWLAQVSIPVPAVPAVCESVGGRAWTALAERSTDMSTAFYDGASNTSVSFAELWHRVQSTVTNLTAAGVEPGHRVAVLVPPSPDLMAVVYACWRMGAVTVIADRGLGVRGLGDAVRSARVQAVIGIPRALRAARVLRWAPRAVHLDVAPLVASPPGGVVSLPAEPESDAPAAVLFTSGATGPAKGVRYTHRQLEAQRDALRQRYGIDANDRLVAAFAPFALYGPALGIPSAIPHVDVTAPGSLTAAALDAACAAIGATMVFASPAALMNVVATSTDVTTPALAQVRTVMSAGAPVPIGVLERVALLAPRASLHTPYGMTEVLPVADVDLTTLRQVGPGRGVCVGHPVEQCSVMITAPDISEVEPLPVGATGEVLINAPWCSQGYDALADVERRARPIVVRADGTSRRWHRSGDLGHMDDQGRLWIEGRVVHALHTAHGLLTPVPFEIAAETVAGVGRAAAVGVGPLGVQHVVIVIEHEPVQPASRRWGRHLELADTGLAHEVRSTIAVSHPTVSVAAVVVIDRLPVDIRHNAKIDRTALARRVEAFLAGAS